MRAAILIHPGLHKYSSSNVEGACKNQCKQCYTCLVTTNFYFSADLGQLYLHHNPKTLLHLGTNRCYKSYLKSGFNMVLLFQMKRHTQALHTYRINLSPFTKDFRVWGAPIET